MVGEARPRNQCYLWLWRVRGNLNRFRNRPRDETRYQGMAWNFPPLRLGITGVQISNVMVPRLRMRKGACLAFIAAISVGSVFAQDPVREEVTAGTQALTLLEALAIARERNGNVRAAFFDLEIARSQTRISEAAFLPTVTPQYRREQVWGTTYTGPFRGSRDETSESASVVANYRILDTGLRSFRLSRDRINLEAQSQSALQTLRGVLFSVHQRYYDALRAQELVEVTEASVRRTQEILDRAEFAASPEIGSGSLLDVLQARADNANAQVSLLEAQNQIAQSEAQLKAVLGFEASEELPTLVAPALEESLPMFDLDLNTAIEIGLTERPDLQAIRLRTRATEQTLRLIRAENTFNFFVDAQYARGFSPNPFDSTALILQLSIPLYDGNASREAIRAQEFNLEGDRAFELQTERDVRADIEAAWKQYDLNRARLSTSLIALEAARANYEAVREARILGAADLIDELTAELSLRTAELNQVNAFYDALISEISLRSAIGRPLPGEDNGASF